MTSPSIIKTVIRFYYITSLVRLANGGASYGCVEVYYSGAWGTVCDDLWDINNANVVCRELGFSRATSAPHGARYGGGTGNIWLDDVESSGGKLHCSTVRMQDGAQEIVAMAITGMQVSFVLKKQEMLSQKQVTFLYLTFTQV